MTESVCQVPGCGAACQPHRAPRMCSRCMGRVPASLRQRLYQARPIGSGPPPREWLAAVALAIAAVQAKTRTCPRCLRLVTIAEDGSLRRHPPVTTGPGKMEACHWRAGR